jgi:subtilisin family serine protease
MAGPHVAGLAAYLLGFEGKYSPAQLTSRITALATKNAVTGLPSGTKNVLVYNGSGR